jgi:hypothetical protein
MTRYDPDRAPDSAAWLALEESERIGRIAAFHAAAGITPPNAQMHAAMHAVVENQIAEEMTTVDDTLARLCAEGLSRHEAVHAIGWVLVSHLTALMGRPGKGREAVEDYFRELRSLTAEGWREHARQKRTI